MKNACMFLVAAALVLPTGAVLADPPGHAKAWGHKDKQGLSLIHISEPTGPY